MKSKIGFFELSFALGVCASVVLFHTINLPYFFKLTPAAHNALHVPGFAIVFICMFWLLRRRLDPKASYFWSITLTIVVAVVAEFFQMIGPRNADFADLGRDIYGLTIALALLMGFDRNSRLLLPKGSFWILSSLAVAAIVFSVRPVIDEHYLAKLRIRALPTILSFDEKWESEIFRTYGGAQGVDTHPPAGWPIDSGKLLQLQLGSDKFSGIEISPHPDWSGFDSLSFWAASADGKTHEFVIRIHDSLHNYRIDDRYSETILIGPIPTRYDISLTAVEASANTRKISLDRIELIILYRRMANSDEIVVIDEFALSKKSDPGRDYLHLQADRL